VEYAKAAPEDILVRVTATNRGPEPATLHVLPTVWFRNTWSWEPGARVRAAAWRGTDRARSRSTTRRAAGDAGVRRRARPALHRERDQPQRVFGAPSATPFVKDGINDYVVGGAARAVNPDGIGTKAAGTIRS
jgi:hypothetical protein